MTEARRTHLWALIHTFVARSVALEVAGAYCDMEGRSVNPTLEVELEKAATALRNYIDGLMETAA